MTKKQIGEARELAMNNDLEGVDCSALWGLSLNTFVAPCYVSLKVVAKMMKDFIMFNGQWDKQEIDEFCKVARYKVVILEQ